MGWHVDFMALDSGAGDAEEARHHGIPHAPLRIGAPPVTPTELSALLVDTAPEPSAILQSRGDL